LCKPCTGNCNHPEKHTGNILTPLKCLFLGLQTPRVLFPATSSAVVGSVQDQWNTQREHDTVVSQRVATELQQLTTPATPANLMSMAHNIAQRQVQVPTC
jgi:hypothetical protein